MFGAVYTTGMGVLPFFVTKSLSSDYQEIGLLIRLIVFALIADCPEKCICANYKMSDISVSDKGALDLRNNPWCYWVVAIMNCAD